MSGSYRLIGTILFSFCTLFCSFQTAPYQIIEDEAKLPLLSPAFAERKVLKMKLPNGIEAFLISDPKADKSAASLSVKVGSWDDPEEYPGLAHFLEHMLFLGTKKYPKTSEYIRFITEHGGTTNAYTTSTHTSYMFSVDNQAYDEALDRFASFFREPLFNPSGVSREMQVIDQEYGQNLDNDDMRGWHVLKQLAAPEHPFHRFNIGNKETLSKTSQEALQQWYHKHYSGNLMSLIVYSNQPIEKLRDMVVADFQGVLNQDSAPTTAAGRIMPDSLHGEMVYVEPVKHLHMVTIVWELPKEFVDMKDTQPDHLVCTVLGHEGEESLLAQLKREDLAEGLRCGSERAGLKEKFISMEIDLTEKGLKEVNTVIKRAFQAIAQFKSKELPKYIFDEAQQMSKINYEYQPREDAFEYVMRQSGHIVNEDLKTFPEQTLIIQKFDPEASKKLLEYLTPQHAYFFLTAPSEITGVPTDQKEKWLGVSYAVHKIDPAVMREWENVEPFAQIQLPAPNPYIPKNLEMVSKKGSKPSENSVLPHPEVIVDNEHGITYYALDTTFRVPIAYASFEIRTPQFDMGNAKKIVLADLYVESVSEALKKISYPASAAGLHYTVEREDYGLSITVSGYSDNVSLLFDQIVKELKEVHPTEQQFEVYKALLLRDYQNMSKSLPIEQAMEMMKKGLYRKFTMDKQKAASIEKMTYKQFENYLSEIFSKVYVQGMIYGNITKEKATSLTDTLVKSLGSPPFPKSQLKKPEVIILPENQGPFYMESPTHAQGNATVLAIEYPEYSAKIQASQQTLMQAMKEEFFAELRTKQQTGYLVFGYPREIERRLFNIFAVQSNSHAARDLLSRFELFIEGYLQDLATEFPEDRFNIVKQALINELKEPAKDIGEMGQILGKLAFDYDADFNWLDKRIQGLKELTYAELLDYSRTAMKKQNKRRLAILLKGEVPQQEVLNFAPIRSFSQLQQLSKYTSGK